MKEISGGLDTPVGIAHAGDKSQRLFIVEKRGRIRVVRDAVLDDAALLDITDRVGSSSSEQGLLGLAFHPDFATNSLLYIYYIANNGDTVVLGGIYESTLTDELDKVPVLGDLPLIGSLFRHTLKRDEKAELLIFVTPKILKETLSL